MTPCQRKNKAQVFPETPGPLPFSSCPPTYMRRSPGRKSSPAGPLLPRAVGAELAAALAPGEVARPGVPRVDKVVRVDVDVGVAGQHSVETERADTLPDGQGRAKPVGRPW